MSLRHSYFRITALLWLVPKEKVSSLESRCSIPSILSKGAPIFESLEKLACATHILPAPSPISTQFSCQNR